MPKIGRYRLKFDPESLTEFPFLRTAIEDFVALQYYVDGDTINRRHIINLMYDTLEFSFYEILLLHEQDIYQNGQNTIGFDAALSICKKLDLDIPLIGTVRTVQKLRGDANHHAQSPDDTSFQQVLRNFPIIMSRLVYEHFHGPLGDAIDRLPLLAHHVALFETHRRRRNHNWSQAAKYALAALLQKHRAMFGKKSQQYFPGVMTVDMLVAILKDEIAAEPYMVAPAEALDAIRQLPVKLKSHIQATDWEKVTDIVVNTYSTIDKLLPDIFDPADAVKLTEDLFRPRALRIRGRGMMWGKVWGAKGSNEGDLINQIGAYLREHPEIVKTFGQPHYEETDERYWRWWEFALFDGSRWHSFHLNTAFEVSLEVAIDTSRAGSTSVKLLEQILDEFRQLIASTG